MSKAPVIINEWLDYSAREYENDLSVADIVGH